MSGILLEAIGATNTILVQPGDTGLLSIATTINSHVRNAKPIDQVQARQRRVSSNTTSRRYNENNEKSPTGASFT